MKKKIGLLSFFVLIITSLQGGTNSQKHVILPRTFHVGQEFIYEGIPYVIVGFDQKKQGNCEKVKLILEHPITFGFEFGTETLVLKVKQGKNEETGTTLHAHTSKRFYSYNWLAYFAAYIVFTHYLQLPVCANVNI